MNYYTLSERTVNESIHEKEDSSPFAYFMTHENLLQHYLNDVFVMREKEGKKEKERKIHYYCVQQSKINDKELKDNLNKTYVPFYKKISYDLEMGRQAKVSAIGEPGEFSNDGYLVSSGQMNEKKVMYVIPEKDKKAGADSIADRIEVPEKDIAAFTIDYNKRKNQVVGSASKSASEEYKKREEYFSLPKDGCERPVFYIQLNQLYFGFTPRLRLFTNNSISDGIPKSHKERRNSLCKEIFGNAGDKAYKSRVSFSDAVFKDKDNDNGGVNEDKPQSLVLGEPKPSAYYNYLRDGKSYNDGNIELRGIKQYWLYDYIKAGGKLKGIEDAESGYGSGRSGNKNDRIGSRLKPLPRGSCFTGKVRFHNLTETELGLLLWSLRLEKGSRMNIGKGKAYGLGTIKIRDLTLAVFDKKKAYSLDFFSASPFIDRSGEIDDIISSYKEFLKTEVGIDPEKNESFRQFFVMKDSGKIPSPKRTSYMSLKDFGNQKSRGKLLPEPDEVINQKS